MSGEETRQGQHAGPVVSLAETWRVAGLLWARESFTTTCGLVGMARRDLMVSRAQFACPGLRESGAEYFRASDPEYVVWTYAEGYRYTLLWYGVQSYGAGEGWHSARLLRDAPADALSQQWLVRALTHIPVPGEVVDGGK